MSEIVKQRNLEVKIWNPKEADSAFRNRFLYSAALSHLAVPFTHEWFSWKFCGNPYGHAIIAYAEDDEGTIAGAVGFSLSKLKYREEEIIAGVSYETFVHPDFRRRGLFRILTTAAQEASAERGAKILYNFPNLASKPGFESLGWRSVGEVLTFFKIYSVNGVVLQALKSRLRGGSAFTPLRHEETPDTLEEDLKFASEMPLSSSDVLAIAREYEYLRFRFITLPRYRYGSHRCGSYVIIYRIGSRLGIKEMQVLDIMCDEIVLTKRGVHTTFEEAAMKERVSVMSLYLTSGHPLTRLLARRGWFQIKNRTSFCNLPLSTGFNWVDSSSNWRLSGLDFHTW